ncbi:protein HEXIM1 [Heliangelus exortis]
MADAAPAEPGPEPEPPCEAEPRGEPEPRSEPEPERGEAADGEAGRLPPPGAEEAAAEGAGGAEGRPAAGGAARPGLGPRYRSSVGRTEEWPVKKKHRRRPSKKKRRWKPYSKLSWEEKQQFDERQSLRASRLRAEMFAKGQPVAPYNTTQFLMEDHDQEEPDLKTGLYPRRAAAKSDDTSEEDFLEEAAEEDGGSDGMGGDGSEFLQRDFSETYERYHVESLQNMSKQELVKEYLELEKCLSRMEEENNRLRMESKKHGGEATETRVRQLELEVDRLRAENLRLLREKDLSGQDPCKQGE